ncbi:tRNA uridine-5-carboxymethylaminomethyl(34) synthesis GTPase MnmE [Devosia geojensis]|uniref:tRNA uridine-5-carboxymethylaminomethyl(34) synthesis GTPase MnmE n=1 Tax=Devosia geojensis TaxID=443610 RepID=UPI00244EC17E|nr:tRNA uridine-5-carboxymethylaminomethyl(34) synthesis GTPase MnmE [Devosia geojensis]
MRMSGPLVPDLLVKHVGGVPQARRLTLMRIGAQSALDSGLVAYFPAPKSFTGEACAELQVHGSPAGVRAILRALTAEAGVRLAEAGEFTRRAFENGKLDLTAVEGLGDLIEAETENQRRQALARYQGGLSRRIDAWREALLDLRAEIEARLDFSDEGDVEETLPEMFASDLAALRDELSDALASLTRGRIVREGVRVALAGPPNAGKSSLLNALAKSDIAIVTDEAGTTRDVREVPVDLGGQLVILVDLAGLRETDSKAEAEGVRRARAEIGRADLVLWLTAPDVDSAEQPPQTHAPVWRVAAKVDIHPRPAGADLAVSVVSADGLADLESRLAAFADELAAGGEPALLSHERDRAAVEAAREAVVRAQARLDAPELAAESLREASQALERLVGRLDAERVLDRLFLSFCIGK